VDGLETSITAADRKLASMQRSRTSAHLGLPAMPAMRQPEQVKEP